MKKSIKLLTLSVFTAGMLAGCGGTPTPSAPDWSAEQKASMREQLHGEVLPFIDNQPDLLWVGQGGEFYALGDEITPEALAVYADKYTAAGGWEVVQNYKDPTSGEIIVYIFEKSVQTQEGERFVQSLFGSYSTTGYPALGGDFYLEATDPYFYDWADVSIKYGIYVASTFESDCLNIPAISADRYEIIDDEDEETGEPYMIMYSYTSDALAADKFYAALAAITGEDAWHVYPGEVEEGVTYYLADSPDGKYGIEYCYNAKYGCLILYVCSAHYLYEFPLTELNEAIAATGSELEAVALEGYRYNIISGEGYFYVTVYVDEIPAEADLGYTALLLEAGWFSNGFDEAAQEFIAVDAAAHADVKASVRYFFIPNSNQTTNPGGVLYITVKSGPAFVSEYPEDALAAFVYSEFYSEDLVPDVEYAEPLYVLNDDLGIFAIYYPCSEEDGYSALLTAAGFHVSYYENELEDGTIVRYAFSPDYEYVIAYARIGDAIDGALSIQFNSVYSMEYDSGEWPVDALVELDAAIGAYHYDVPALEIADAQAYFNASIYTETIEFFGYEFEVPVATLVYSEGASKAELEAYVGKLEAAEWELASGSSYVGGTATKVDSGADGELEIFWMSEQIGEDCYAAIILIYYVDKAPETFDEYPVEYIAKYFQGLGLNVADVPFGNYVIAATDGYFKPYFDYYGQYNVDAFGSTAEDQVAFVADLIELGWTKVSTDDPLAPNDATLTYGNTGIYVSVVDWIDYDGSVGLVFYYIKPYEHSDVFPLTELNAFLTEYDLGFTLDSALPTAEGKGYDYKTDVYDDYHCFKIVLSGNQFDAVVASLSSGLVAGGYVLDEEESGENVSIYYNPENYHEVDIEFNEITGETTVVFWE